MKIHCNTTALLLGIGLFLGAASGLMAESGTVQHHHEHGAAASSLTLNNGKKWATDAPLHQAMLSINREVMRVAGAFHDNTLGKADAEKLAGHIREQVEYMVANCKLEPRADAVLHVLIGELLQGAQTLQHTPLSSSGLPYLIQTLDRYAHYFDHPGWSMKHP